VTGVYVDAINQTSGIGSHVADDDVKNQFVGLNASSNVTMGEGGLDGYSGATFSSKALFAAVNDCIDAYNEVA
jgi:electron transport complex protein RnfG